MEEDEKKEQEVKKSPHKLKSFASINTEKGFTNQPPKVKDYQEIAKELNDELNIPR